MGVALLLAVVLYSCAAGAQPTSPTTSTTLPFPVALEGAVEIADFNWCMDHMMGVRTSASRLGIGSRPAQATKSNFEVWIAETPDDFAASCLTAQELSTTPPSTAAIRAPSTGCDGSTAVVYEVAGSAGSVAITMQNDTGGTDQFTTSVPWKKTLCGFSSGEFVYLSGQNQGGGTLDCRIRVNGSDRYKSSAAGEYAICTASGTA